MKCKVRRDSGWKEDGVEEDGVCVEDIDEGMEETGGSCIAEG